MINDDRKYKYTKQLLKIAKECGNYNNGDIAVKAGLSRKSVKMSSNWCTGKNLATERQMNYFIKTYEHLLKRKLEHLFYYGEIVNDKTGVRFSKLSGEVILKHQLKIEINDRYGKKDKTVTVLRLVIISNSNKFHVIRQYRAGVISYREYPEHGRQSSFDLKQASRCDNEEANWFSYSFEIDLDFEGLIKSFNDFIEKMLNGDNPIDIASNNGRLPKKSRFFSANDDYSLTYVFYQKMMKLGLNIDSFLCLDNSLP